MGYCTQEPGAVLKELKSDERGLSGEEAKKRLLQHGLNRLKEKKRISALQIFLSQFRSFIVAILISAMLLSLLIGEVIDAIVISIILIFNAIFGFLQEFKAEKAIAALKKLSSPKARVVRDSKETEIAADELVPGDILLLSEGNCINADARLIEAKNLECQEASLTGESKPVRKNSSALSSLSADKEIQVADQNNMVFAGTVVTMGRARAVVVGTAMKTEIGKIATMLQEQEEEPTPLQVKLAKVGKWLGIGTILICALVFLINTLRGGDITEVFLASIALAVAAIPEGLPAVVTISLALGVQRMIKRNALIRRLASVETLGATTVICTDKTGTLTHNEMTVLTVAVGSEVLQLTGEGYETTGQFQKDKKAVSPDQHSDLSMLLRIGALCNDARLVDADHIIGDPTEAALLVSAAKAGMSRESLEKAYPRIDEMPFDSARKRMTTFHQEKGQGQVGGRILAAVKGAPDVILEHCTSILVNGKEKRLTAADKKRINEMNEQFAGKALRVLGFAYRYITRQQAKQFRESGLTFVGLQAMLDPPRQEVRASIAKCRNAGIRVVMITGDHKLTAMAIAKELGMEGKALTGAELDTVKDLEEQVDEIAIYARVNPKHKMQIVDALKKKGHIVAMGGDGVNDAPALKAADIGVAMGITGTDVAKGASDMVLTDDNFSSIVNAVEEGRGIYDNIKKFVNYLLSSNFGEVLVLFFGGLIFNQLPLIAVQILWINLITDGLPALALGVDPADKKIMQRRPRDPKGGIINRNMSLNIMVIGIIICIGTLYLFGIGLETGLAKGMTMAFAALVVFELVRLQMIRSQYRTGMFSNRWLILAVMSSISLQLVVIYSPLSKVFKVVPLGMMDWAYIAVVAAILFVIGTIASLVIRKATHETD